VFDFCLVVGIMVCLTALLIDLSYLLDLIFILLVIITCIYFIDDVHTLLF
jgi:hypothetical protein